MAQMSFVQNCTKSGVLSCFPYLQSPEKPVITGVFRFVQVCTKIFDFLVFALIYTNHINIVKIAVDSGMCIMPTEQRILIQT